MKLPWEYKRHPAISGSPPEGHYDLEGFGSSSGLCLDEWVSPPFDGALYLHPTRQLPPSPSRSETPTEQQLSQWAVRHQYLSRSRKLKYRCPLLNCKGKFRRAGEMLQHIASIHHPIYDCTCPNHDNVGQRDLSNGAQDQCSLKWWRRYKVMTALMECFKLGRATQEEPCPVHYYPGEPSELAATPDTAEFDGTCNMRYEIGHWDAHMADSNSVFEIGSPVAGRVYEIGPGTPRYELSAESVPLLACPTQPIILRNIDSAYINHPLDVDAGPLTIDGPLEPYSPVSPISPISPDGSGGISDHDFTVYPPVFDHDHLSTLGAESIALQGLVAPNHDVVMSGSYDYNPVGINDQTNPDPQAGPVDLQTSYGLHPGASEDLARLHHTVSIVKRAQSKVVYELIDNAAVAFDAVQSALRHDPGLWLRDYAIPFSSPNSLLERCLQALRKVALGSPLTAEDAGYEMFYLKYFAVTTIRIPRGFCVWEHERDLSQCGDPSLCLRVVKDVCFRTVDLMCHFETIRRRLDGLPNMAHPVLRPVSYIKETVVPALLREPRMDVFKYSVTDTVDCLDPQRLHDLHDVVVRLIYNVHCEGQLYIDYVTSVILASHAALVDTSGLQPSTMHISMIDELIYTVADPTPATPCRAPSALLYSDKGKRQRPTRVPSPTDSGYYSSPTTPPNTPGEEENFGSPTKRLRTDYSASQQPAMPSASPPPVRPAAQRPYPLHTNAPAPLQIPPPAPKAPVLKCKYCNYEPKPHPDWRYRKSNLTRHEKDVHREKGFKHICPACSKAVGRPDNFKKHLHKHEELRDITAAEIKACRIWSQS